jgi:class 3 adenylate cyclase
LPTPGCTPDRSSEHDRDYFGRTVNLASRVTGVAQVGEVVVTQDVKSAVESDGYVFET